MRVLFLHRQFPGQFRHIAAALAADPGNEVVFLSLPGEGALPGVTRAAFRPARDPRPQTHRYLRPMEAAVLTGQAVWRAADRLRRSGFVPDLIAAHAGTGVCLYVKDVFPDAPLLGYFEWYYHGRGGDAAYLEPAGLTPDELCRIRTRNGCVLPDLIQADRAVCPTHFQAAQFPAPFRERLTVLHDGIDTDWLEPGAEPARTIAGIDLAGAQAVVTYATRGMEPYRGFPQFMRAAALLLERHPRLHVVVGGADTVAYGRSPPGGSWKAAMLAELPGLDPARLHFPGFLGGEDWRLLLHLSSAHVYLTIPFVLSWSLLEAMAAGAPVIASDNAAVREVVEDGVTGLLADFFDPAAIAARVEELLADRPAAAALGRRARARVRRDFALHRILPRQLALYAAAAERTSPNKSAMADNNTEEESKSIAAFS